MLRKGQALGRRAGTITASAVCSPDLDLPNQTNTKGHCHLALGPPWVKPPCILSWPQPRSPSLSESTVGQRKSTGLGSVKYGPATDSPRASVPLTNKRETQLYYLSHCEVKCHMQESLHKPCRVPTESHFQSGKQASPPRGSSEALTHWGSLEGEQKQHPPDTVTM